MGNYYKLYWSCPYYHGNARCAVRCEGGEIRMPDTDAAKTYFREYCADLYGWRRCTVARAISRHYEAREDEE